MKYTTGLPTPKFADLLIRLREEGVEGYPPSLGVEGVPAGGAVASNQQGDVPLISSAVVGGAFVRVFPGAGPEWWTGV